MIIDSKTSPKLAFLIESFMIPANDRNASEDCLIATVLMQSSRFLNWHRVKFAGLKGWEFPMLYAFNFAKSGAYKDEPALSLIDVIKDLLDDQARMKSVNFEVRMDKYDRELKKLTGEMKKRFAIEGKPKRFKNEFERGSSVGFQQNRMGAMQAGMGHIHYKNEEFVDNYGEIDSTADDILSMAKTIHRKGNSASNTIGGEWRDSVEDVPLTMFLHSSSDRLSEDQKLLKRFLSVLGTGLAKRSYILFDNKLKRVNRSAEEVISDKQLVRSSIAQAKRIFSDMYDAIKIHEGKDGYLYQTIKVSKEAEEMQNDYRNICNGIATDIDSEIIQAEIYDRFWRAMRLAVCIAALEHPYQLEVMPKDYLLACNLTDRWGDQFKAFVLKERNLNIDQLYSHVKTCEKISKTEIRKLIGAKKVYEIDDAIKQIEVMADENNMILDKQKGRGLAVYYALIDPSAVSEELETEVLAYIRENCTESLVTIDKLVKKFGKEAGVVIVKHQIPRDESTGGYYLN